MRLFIFLTICFLGPQAHAQAPAAKRTPLPAKASVEQGLNFQAMGGFFLGNGKTREVFLFTSEAGDWTSGLVSKVPYLDLGFSYAPSSKIEFGLQVPLALWLSSLNGHYSFDDNWAVGVKIGVASSAYLTASYEAKNWFLSLSPAVTFYAPRDEKEQEDESRVSLGGQLSIGFNRDPADYALIVSYDYAIMGDGAAVDLFNHTLLKHFLTMGISVKF